MEQNSFNDFEDAVIELFRNAKREVVCQSAALSLITQADIDRLKWWPQSLIKCHFPAILASEPKEGGVITEQLSVVESDETGDHDVFKHNDNEVTSKRKISHDDTDGNDVCGSPLRLQKFVDLSQFHSPNQFGSCGSPLMRRSTTSIAEGISLSKARQLLSFMAIVMGKKCFKSDNGVKTVLPSLLVLCDGNDLKRTAAMYYEPVCKGGNFTGHKMSRLCMKESMTTEDHLLKLDRISIPGSQVECQAIYDVFDTDKDTIRSQDGYQGSLLLDLKWDKLAHQPPPEARTMVKARVSSGDPRSAAYVLYRELDALKSFLTGLKKAEVGWRQEQNEKPIMETLKGLLDQLKMGDAVNTMAKEDQDEFLAVLDTLVFDDRKDLDFTDHLWSVLVNCTSYGELLDCLTHVFTVLSQGDLNPMVHRNNQTTMAQLVRDSYTGKMRFPNLAGQYPLQLLVEMGIEKLRQDYTFTFLSKGLVTLENLQPFIKISTNLDENLKNLEKMHEVLEMVVMLRLFLNLPTDNLASCASEMFDYFDQNDVVLGDLFCFVVPTTSVKHMFETCKPCTIKTEFSVLVEGEKESSVHLLTVRQPFKHLCNKNVSLLDPVSDNDNEFHYVHKQDSLVYVI